MISSYFLCTALPESTSGLKSAISALEREIAILEKSSGCWEKSLPWFTGLVVIGLIVEAIVVFHEHKNGTLAWRRGTIRSPERPSGFRFLLELIGSIAIVIGVAGELWAGAEIAYINGQLRTKNAALRDKSGQLIALLEKEAALIEQSLAWRTLSEKDENILKARLSPFKQVIFSIWFKMGDTEAEAFAWQIAGSLHQAHLKVLSPASVLDGSEPGHPFAPSLANLQTGIRAASTSDPASREAAKVVVTSLRNSGFDASSDPTFNKGSGAVWITVAGRPKGPQGEARLIQQDQSR